jgi:ATP-dependent Clp protease ATP-binding subunit ClpB
MFENENAIVRIDMSEYMEKHSVARLIGSPPGYVGYESGGLLTEQVRRNPYSVILFDEIEKAHPDIFNVLLQLLDEGRLTDGQGNTVNFKNTLIIMTSNLGSHIKESDKDLLKAKVNIEVESFFKPEFINRLDDIVIFDKLSKQEIYEITKMQVDKLIERVKEQGIKLMISNDVLVYLAKEGFDEVYGARPIKRVIKNLLEGKLASLIIKNKPTEIFVDIKNETLHFV